MELGGKNWMDPVRNRETIFFVWISCENDESGVAPRTEEVLYDWLEVGIIIAGRFTQVFYFLKENIRKEICIIRIMRMFIQFVRNQWTCRRKKKNRIHLTLQKGQRCTSSSQKLKSNYNFDLNLHWMMILRYTYGGTSSSGNGLTISEQQNSVIYLDMWWIVGNWKNKLEMSLRSKLPFVDHVLCYARFYSNVQSLTIFNEFLSKFHRDVLRPISNSQENIPRCPSAFEWELCASCSP
jgi:hypothetical protein